MSSSRCGRVLRDPARPFVVLLGGLKVSDKISLIQNMLKQADAILVGGAMANAFLKAQGHEIGVSKGDGEQTAVAAEALAAAGEAGRELLLPVDVVVAPVPEAGAPAQTVAAGAIPADQMALDIGPETAALYAGRLAAAGTVYWNGPMGLFEVADFAAGTRAVGEAVAASAGRDGRRRGDTIAAVRAFGLEGRLTHVSTGGGASMEFLEGRALPGVEALMDGDRDA